MSLGAHFCACQVQVHAGGTVPRVLWERREINSRFPLTFECVLSTIFLAKYVLTHIRLR